jgi:hypothetical protein
MSEILKKTYHVRKYDNFIHEAKKTKKARQDGPEPISLGEALELEMDKVHDHEKENAVEFKSLTTIGEKGMASLFFALVNRSRFRYSTKHIIEYVLRCLCLRDLEEQKDRMSIKRHFLFQKAEEKFMQELDVVRIVKTLRRFKMLSQALLAQRHRLLLRYQRMNLVETEDSSPDSDDQDFDPVRMVENSNPMVRLISYGRVKKLIN